MNANVGVNNPDVKGPIVYATSNLADQHPFTSIIERYSSWSRLKRIVASVLRYKTKLLSLSKKQRAGESVVITSDDTVTSIDMNEIRSAEVEIIKHIQNQCFKEERDILNKANQRESSKEAKVLKKSSKIFKLDPMVSRGLLRVGGHLHRAPINRDAKYPIELPKNHHVVTLIIKHYQHLSGHIGLEYTLSLIRQRYWIINAR